MDGEGGKKHKSQKLVSNNETEVNTATHLAHWALNSVSFCEGEELREQTQTA